MTAPNTQQQPPPPNPFAPPPPRRPGPPNPFAAPPATPNPSPSVVGGPNPSHLNQTGAAPQFQPPPPPSYSAQLGQAQPMSSVQSVGASPNPTVSNLRVVPEFAQQNPTTNPTGTHAAPAQASADAPTGTHAAQTPPTQTASAPLSNTPANPPPSTGYSPWGATPQFAGSAQAKTGNNQWQDALMRANQVGTAMDPYAASSASRLQGLGGNYAPATMGGTYTSIGQPTDYNPLQGGLAGATGDALGRVGQAGANLAGTPDVVSRAGTIGGQYSDLLGNGQVGAQTADAATLKRLGGYQGMTDKVAGNVINGPAADQQTFALTKQYQGLLGTGQVGGATVDRARADAYTGAQDKALAGLQNTPNRQALATAAFNTQNAVADRAGERQLNEYRQQQAADGRLGLSTDRGAEDIMSRLQQERDARSAGLALDTASGSMQDQLAKLSATQGLVGQQEGLVAGNRDYATQLGVGNVTRQADNASRAAQLGGNTAGLTNSVGLSRLNAASGLTGNVQGQANLDRNYATDLGVGNTTRRAANAATAYGLGGSLAGSSAAHDVARVGAQNANLGAISGLQAQTFGQAAQQQGVQLTQAQQQYANSLGLNAQQFSQMMGLAGYSDPTKLLKSYSNLASDEANVTRTRITG